MKKYMILLSVLFIVGSLVGCGNTQKSVEEKPLIVGMELAYPPFETKDTQGNATGVSVDLAKALGDYLGRPVKIENINWDGLIPSLQTGQVDAVISSMTITEERSKTVDFSKPYAHAYLAVLVNEHSQVNSAADLNQPEIVIAVKKGTTGNVYGSKNLSKATINALSSENACVTEVVQGKADAFIYDQLTIYRQNLNNPETTKAVFIPSQNSEAWGIAVKKGNTELLGQINEFLDGYKKEGGFNTLSEKHLATEKKTFGELGFPWFFD